MSGDTDLEEAARLAAGLGIDPTHLLVGRMENLLREAHDGIDLFLREGVEETRNAAEFAITHLVCRSGADLRAATLLMGSGFIVQGFSVVRPIAESMNLIDLFVRSPERADAWVEGERHHQFSASAVRGELGLGADEPYSTMCERSHPRFAAAQLSGWMDREESGVLTTGGLPIEHPQVRLSMVVLGTLTPRVAFAAGHVRVRGEAIGQWAPCVRSVTETVVPGIEELLGSLGRPGEAAFGEDVADAIRAALGLSEQLVSEAASVSRETAGE